MDSSTSRKHAGVVIAIAFALLYLLTATRNYYWDGIAFALVIERHQHWYELFSVHHLLYEFIGAGAYKAFGGHVRALYLMQILNSIAGGVLLALVYRLLRSLEVHEGNAAAWTAFMGAAATFWRFSTDADAYILPNVLLVWTYLLLVRHRVPAPVRVGLIHAAAMLLHQISALFYPVALFCLWRQSRERWWRNAAVYSVLSAGITLSVYWWAYRNIPNKETPTFAAWLTYHADVPFSFDALKNALWIAKGTVRLFVGGKIGRMEWDGVTVAAAVLLFVAVAFTAASVRRVRRQISSVRDAALILWVAVYVAFLFFWEPQNTFYRLFYVIPLICVIALATRTWTDARFVAGLAAIVLLFNFTLYIRPNMEAKNNPPLAVAMEQQKVWPAGTGVVFAQFVPDLWTISYFNAQVAWIGVDSPDPARLNEYVQDFGRNGGSIWVDWTYLQRSGEKVEPFTFRKVTPQ